MVPTSPGATALRVIVDQLELHPGNRPSDRGGHDLVRVAGSRPGAERRLGGGVADHDRAP